MDQKIGHLPILLLVPIMLLISVQKGNLRHFLVCKLETEQIQVLPDVIGVAGAWDNTHAFLQIPAENYLSRRFSMYCCNLSQQGIIQH